MISRIVEKGARRCRDVGEGRLVLRDRIPIVVAGSCLVSMSSSSRTKFFSFTRVHVFLAGVDTFLRTFYLVDYNRSPQDRR